MTRHEAISLHDSRTVRKNRCHILGHGQLIGNSTGRAKSYKSISREPMVVQTWLAPQNDRKTSFSESLQANYTYAAIGSVTKMYFSNRW